MISMLIPFPISLVIIVGTFLLLNVYLRRRMMAGMGSLKASNIMGGMFSPTATYSSSPLKYYCMSCGTQHKQDKKVGKVKVKAKSKRRAS